MKILLTFLTAAVIFPVAAQTITITDTIHVSEYSQLSGLPGRKQLLLETGFAGPFILNPSEATILQGKTIESVELVYTHYWQSSSFPQASLNKKRISSLRATAPSLFNDPLIDWKLVAQHPATADEAKDMFHGFVITYRHEPTKESMKEELSYLEDILSGKRTSAHSVKTETRREVSKASKDKIPEKSLAEVSSSSTISGTDILMPVIAIHEYPFSYSINYDGSITWFVNMRDTALTNDLLSKGGKITGFYTDSGSSDTIRHIYTKGTFTPITPKARLEAAPAGYFTYTWTVDSTVIKVLERKKKQWKDMLIVGDLTGSMSPYSAQLFMWYKLNMKTDPVKEFVFFNDGDWKQDHLKVAGATGGIYYTNEKSFEEVMETARKTMNSGSGGDCPENNVEAAIAGLEQCPDCDAVVMIADNYATPRDLELAYKIGKPLKIILCGATNGINAEYLNLARYTGGSVHLVEQDLEELTKINEGEIIKVGKNMYRLEKGQFVRVKEG